VANQLANSWSSFGRRKVAVNTTTARGLGNPLRIEDKVRYRSISVRSTLNDEGTAENGGR